MSGSAVYDSDARVDLNLSGQTLPEATRSRLGRPERY